jgi:hypothetical protein
MVQMTTQQLQELLRQAAKEGAELALSRTNNSSGSSTGGGLRQQCSFCHRPGHTKDQCRAFARTQQPPPPQLPPLGAAPKPSFVSGGYLQSTKQVRFEQAAGEEDTGRGRGPEFPPPKTAATATLPAAFVSNSYAAQSMPCERAVQAAALSAQLPSASQPYGAPLSILRVNDPYLEFPAEDEYFCG